jgi:hypothetical protein
MFYRIEGWVQTPLGEAVAGADVAILDQPADFTTQPGSPLAAIYSSDATNSATVTAAIWNAQQIQFTLNAVPSDVVENSYISVSGASPSGFNSTTEDPWLVVSVVGLVVTVVALSNPGTWVSGGTVATSILPNPVLTDGNGYWFAYTTAGLVSVQVYYGTVELDYPDQPVGTVAGGSVLSVALTAPVQFTIAGSPVTTTGTLAISWATQTANLVLAGPGSGSAAAPTFRSLVAADIPTLSYAKSVALTISVPAILTQSVSGSPVTGTGTLAITLGLATESANFVWAGPTSGAAAQPAFRALVTADMPNVLIVVKTLSGSTDALTYSSDNFVTTAGIDGMTLGTPTATTDDGKVVIVTDVGGHAHTITAAANKIVPSHHLATFNGTAGSYIELEAYQGLWYVRQSNGVAVT